MPFCIISKYWNADRVTFAFLHEERRCTESVLVTGPGAPGAHHVVPKTTIPEDTLLFSGTYVDNNISPGANAGAGLQHLRA